MAPSAFYYKFVHYLLLNDAIIVSPSPNNHVKETGDHYIFDKLELLNINYNNDMSCSF